MNVKLPSCPKCLRGSFSQVDEEPLGECLDCGETYFLGLPYLDIKKLTRREKNIITKRLQEGGNYVWQKTETPTEPKGVIE